MVDLTAIDHGTDAEERFSVVLHIYSRIHRNYLECTHLVELNVNPQNSPVFPHFPQQIGMKGNLRYVGIVFTDHPNMKRILCGTNIHIFPYARIPAGIETDLPADVVKSQAEVEPAHDAGPSLPQTKVL